MLIYRRPQSADFEQMVELQNRNLISVLEPLEAQDGFLATAFTVEQFKEIDRGLCVFVAVDKDTVCGYLCASTPEFNQDFPILSLMLECCSTLLYHGKPLTDYRYFIASPVCIERAYRGKMVFAHLADKILNCIPKDYELIVTLISEKNTRSLHATEKMGLKIIDRFLAGDHYFYILARLV
jgi:hypothetical protein